MPRSLRSRSSATALACALVLVAGAAHAQDAGARGIALARQGKCEQAIPLLEQAELSMHRPAVMLALADCQAKQGDLLAAREMYHALAAEKPTRKSTGPDIQAIQAAARRARDADDRAPTVRFEIPETYEGLEIKVDNTVVADPSKPMYLNPNITSKVTAKAKGYKKYEKDVTLAERERFVLDLRLVRAKGGASEPKDGDARRDRRRRPPDDKWVYWFGAHGRGYVIPRFVMNAFAEGGRTIFAPGGGLDLTYSTSGFDLVVALDAIAYHMSPTPIKQKGAPDTDWELVDSSLNALQLEVDFLWNTPLDDKDSWRFRYGFGVGVGYMVAGALRRTQAFPAEGVPGDPYTYVPCNGPNDPQGTWAYCNSLDKDANHYRYKEEDWFHGGKRPSLFPWATLPKIGLSYLPSKDIAFDLDVGLSLSGLMTGFGMRFLL